MTIGEAVKFIRQLSRESQKAFAAKLDCCPETIRQIEHGNARHPNSRIVGSIFRVYGICPYTLVAMSTEGFDLEAHRALVVGWKAKSVPCA